VRRRVGVVLAAAVVLTSVAAPAQAVEPETRPAGESTEAAPPGTPPPFPQQGTGELAKGSWIVMLKAGANPRADAPGLARRAGGSVGHVYTHALRGFQFKGSAKAAAALRRNPKVVSVTAD